MKAQYWVVGLLTVGSLVVGACGGAAAPTATPTKAPGAVAPTAAPTAAAPTPTRMAAPTATPAPAGEKPRGKVTIVIPEAGPQPLDPHKAVGGSAAPSYNQMFEGVLGLDLESRVEGRLATSWEAKENATIWEFKIRPGVKFHNGDLMTLEDVKFSFEKQKKDTGTAAINSLREMASAEVVDAQTIRVKLTKPVSVFEYRAGIGIEPKAYVEKIGPEQFAKESPVGTGPFKFVSRRLDEFMNFEAFEGHWRRPPYVQSYTLRFASESSVRLAMLKAGEADVMGGVTPTQAQEISKTPGLRTVKALNTGLMWMWFFGASTRVNNINVPRPESPWVNKLVRQAANYAVDRDAIVKGIFQGDGEPMVTLVMPGAFGFNPNLKPYPYDPKKARELLAQAGYPSGFTSDLYSLPSHGAINFPAETTVAVAKFFADVGIKTNIKSIEYGAYLVQVRERKIDGLGVVASSFNAEGTSPLENWSSSRNWASPGLDDRIETGLDKVYSEADRAKREAMVQDLVALDYDNATNLFLVYGNTVYGVNSRVSDWPLRRGYPYLDRVDLLRLAE